MRPVIIFAGTTEGRLLAEELSGRAIRVTACVATEYGEALLRENEYLSVHRGRMDEPQIEAFLEEQQALTVVDATHPYAVEVSKNVSEACRRTGREYIRLLREIDQSAESEAIVVDSVEAAVEYLKETEGNILATTGSKELAKYTAIPGYEKRVYARVLSTADAVAACRELGFQGRNLICMQGPFSEELNTAMLREFDCKYLVTKETGKEGGFQEKVRAAKRAGARLVLVGRPSEQGGCSYAETLRRLGLGSAPLEEGKTVPEKQERVVRLVGIGMGTAESMTLEAVRAIGDAQLLIGAKRMLEAAGDPGTPTFTAYDPREIADYIALHPEYTNVAVLLSGDIGFYSGAKRLYEALQGSGCRVEGVCGVSSVVYFCGKLHLPWEDVCLKSVHGREENLVGAVRTHEKTFTLLSAKDSVKKLCEELLEYGLGHVRVYVGERLGYPEERITAGSPAELSGGSYDGLCVALIENPRAEKRIRACIEDGAFRRGSAPMTKSEIRCLSVAKLRAARDAVVYDVGAGTGSVSVELAHQAVDGAVYAIERDEEACGLIEENKRIFGAPNIHVVHGMAPAALDALPAPDGAFIGGSSGNLKEILRVLLDKNPGVRLVINAVTLETVSEVTDCLRTLPLIEEETICVNVARARLLGNYHLMSGQNPVYLIVCRGGEKE